MAQLTPRSRQVSARVEAAIKSSPLSQTAVADITGIPRETLRRRVRGISAFTVDELESIARVLEVDPDDLFGVTKPGGRRAS
ncbi:helix-turn-helix domain-containing protein [Nocardia sp. NPDC057227]|uniref:helix-turn-helix domain-containing protein n=1 Tax=Nocardia sp. NPDC057227 TaxID=3346056 RepID=UPI003626C461